jgi:hypothetical protein
MELSKTRSVPPPENVTVLEATEPPLAASISPPLIVVPLAVS